MTLPPVSISVATARGLLEGLGAEDIAVRNGLRAEDVRFQIRRLRASGALDCLIEQAREEARKRA